ncbi:MULTISPECIES: MFS transporter [Nostocales]|uniref:MFS transporter n=3 Tax=Nostocales TaxID=1161 RepID=A0A0C1NKB4_9CYAN|nr:MFS transporter [Tolypothrix bouteillei]KAF3887749.1 MFS transporter [Tolypothrix bouteillei VB521301]
MENQSLANPKPFLLQPSSYQVWAQAIARFLYQGGYGTIQFFIPLIFVNQLNFSATVVGFAVGCGALAGVVGHFLGGYLADSPAYGRKRTLLFSALLSILAAIALALLPNLSMLIVVNLLMGLSAGCYWTAADAAVIDVTPPKEHQKAFAILVLADSIGSGLGILSGGLVLSTVTQPQTLFLMAGLILLVFLVTIQVAIADSHQEANEHSNPLQGFSLALKDSSLQVFMLVNVLFTTYIALVSTTLPLYFTNFVFIGISQTNSDAGSSLVSVANLFTWCYVGIGSVLQLPLVQLLTSLLNVRVLTISMLLWSAGFILVWATHLMPSIAIFGTIAAFSVLSIASAIYKPFAPALIAELAPQSLRAVYLAIGYQCWSIGYFVGPILGGWAMDRSPAIAHGLWIAISISSVFGLFMLHILRLKKFSLDSP